MFNGIAQGILLECQGSMLLPVPQVPDAHVAEVVRPYGQHVAAGRQREHGRARIHATELPEVLAGGRIADVNGSGARLAKGDPRFVRRKGPTMHSTLVE